MLHQRQGRAELLHTNSNCMAMLGMPIAWHCWGCQLHGIAGDANCQNTAQEYTQVVFRTMVSVIHLIVRAFDH